MNTLKLYIKRATEKSVIMPGYLDPSFCVPFFFFRLSGSFRSSIFYIVPVLPYASESSALCKPDETPLTAFERILLRRIPNPVCVEGQWRSRYNDEVYEMYVNLCLMPV